MRLTPQQIREHALRIGKEILEAAEFYDVVEDEQLEETDDKDLNLIYRAILDLDVIAK